MTNINILKTCTVLSRLVALGGCNDVIDLDPIDDSPPVEPRSRPAPIIGGTLTLTGDGLAIAADPDRGLIHIVDINTRTPLHTITLEAGDQPGRIALSDDGHAHVVLRGFGGIATIDPSQGTVLARHQLCPEPRGIAFHDGDSSLYVACAGGSLLHLSKAGAELERHKLQPDLRDVLIVDGEVKVSLFREAAIIGLDGSRIDIPALDLFVFKGFEEKVERFEPHVAWRTWVDEKGEISMLHQVASTTTVPINPDPDELPEGESPYGGGGGCEMGLVNVAFTTINGDQITTTPLPGSKLTVDAAVSPNDEWVAMAVPGAREPDPESQNDVFFEETRSTMRIEGKHEGDCFSHSFAEIKAQITSVAYTSSGGLVMQSREPAALLFMDYGPDGVVNTVKLEGEPRFDTGHEIFHRSTDSGLSCASCHPEGTDDGHVWRFKDLGKRRTQPLDVGLEDTAPFHWDGDMPDFDVLMSEVLAHRMGGKRQTPARSDSFTRWMFEQQRPAAATGLESPSIVAEGKALFASYSWRRQAGADASTGRPPSALHARWTLANADRRGPRHARDDGLPERPSGGHRRDHGVSAHALACVRCHRARCRGARCRGARYSGGARAPLMIIVTGTKRSGTSMWMHLLVEAGLPYIGDRFPEGWGELLRAANPDGFFESELMVGINFRTNPHPLTGAYLAPHQTQNYAVKVFIPGLIRSDVAFIDCCIATVRGWRAYVTSIRRVGIEDAVLSPALEWWCTNYSLIRDIAIRGYPAHVVSYDNLLREPEKVATEVLEWIGQGDAERAARVVQPQMTRAHVHETDAALADGLVPSHLEVFDELYATIDAGRPLTASFVDKLNQVDGELRPAVLERQARIDATTIADILRPE